MLPVECSVVTVEGTAKPSVNASIMSEVPHPAAGSVYADV